VRIGAMPRNRLSTEAFCARIQRGPFEFAKGMPQA
jgi:hypothetical protein